MRKLKDSGVEWIGEIPTDWSIGRIKYNFYLKGRIGWQGLKADEFVDNGPFLVTGTDFENGNVNWSKCYHISEERYMEAPEIHVENGDLLVTKDGTVGKVAYINNKPEKVSLNSHLLLIRPNSQLYYNKFLFWVIQSPIFDKYFSLSQNGTIMASLSQEKINNFSFPLPGMETQQCIADYLDRKCSQIDAIIARQQEVIEKLKDYKLSVITEAVTKGLNPDVPMKDSGIEWIGKTPKHWQLTKIKWVADTCSGGTPPSGDLSFYDGGINWVCSYDLHEDAIKCTQRTLSEEGAEIIAGKMQKPNSILIAMYGGSGTIGNSGILSCYARTNQAVCSVYFDEKLMNPKFALYQTIFMRKYWMYYAVGSRKDPNISQDTIRNMHYIIPPMQEQEAIVEWIESRINVVECIQRKKSNIIEKLADYKKSLIYEVVTGKKEV